MRMSAYQKYYAVYEKATDRLLACGTSVECAKQLGFTNPSSFYNLVHDVNSGKSKKYELYTEDLEVSDDEDEE